MRRTRRAPLIGEINPESAADTIAVSIWAAVATIVTETKPQLAEQILDLEWYLLLLLFAFSIAIVFAVVRVPLSYFGLIYRDDSDLSGGRP